MNFNGEMEMIRRGAVEIISEKELLEKLNIASQEKRSLRVKLGLDPSRPDVHLGHTVVLKKLRCFQDMGHTAVLILGDYTAMIGDPSGRNVMRPALTFEETRANARTYEEQAFKILDPQKTEVVWNSNWFSKMTFKEILGLASKITVARLLERDDFAQRYKKGDPLSLHELLYPLMQAYDSVQVHADLELGGTDQKFNILAGRGLQKSLGQIPQVVITFPLLEGTDGTQKMSKSLDNYIALNDTPEDMYGKVMSIPDALICKYFQLLTDEPLDKIDNVRSQMASGANPMGFKKDLAHKIVTIYHSAGMASMGQKAFEGTFQKGFFPEDAPVFSIEAKDLDHDQIGLIQVLYLTKLADSKSDARRLLEQGAVSIDGQKAIGSVLTIQTGKIVNIQVGKRRFLKLSR